MPDSAATPPADPSPLPPTGGHIASGRLTIGERVVVRYRLVDDPSGRATDVIGELLARSPDELVVATAQDTVRLRREHVIRAKDVPPPASRRGPAHLRVSAADLQKVMAKGWRGAEEARLGDWLLRSAPGYTGRANSVLPVGDPSLSADKAIDWCEAWYAERGASALFQVFGDEGFAADDDPVGAALLQRGYTLGHGALVMTALSANVPALTEQSPPVVADAALTPAWLMALGQDGPVVPGVTEQVLTGSDGQLFLRVEEPLGPGRERVVGIGRVAIHPGWAGLFTVRVADEVRRTGIGTAIVSAAAMVARENTMPAMYLQVSAENVDAISFWRRLGFVVHHEYRYLVQP